jgi:NAD(P)-dependent dehydrogenase (short-subunit alcohol dehydrogenase family)
MSHTILITGANRGIGLECVKQYALKGWQVLACCRKPESAKELSELAKAHTHVSVLPLDVTNEAAIKQLATQLVNQPIDILLNNAGVSLDDENGFGSVSGDDWQMTMKTNALAPVLISQALVENVAKSNKKIMAFISSKMGSIADNEYGMYYAYRASKAALNAQVMSMAIDLKDRGITTIAVHPGWVQTDMGGPEATINTQTSVEGLSKILDQLNLEDSGTFRGYNGEHIPW